MTLQNFRELILKGSDIASLVATVKSDILEINPVTLKEIKEEFLLDGTFNGTLEYSKKATLSTYSNKLVSMLDKIYNETTNKDIKKSLKGLFAPLYSVLEAREFLIDLRFHKFDGLNDKEALIKFCYKCINSKNSDFFAINSTSLEMTGTTVNYKLGGRVISKNLIKELNGSNEPEGGASYSASSLLQYLRNEIEANKLNTQKIIADYREAVTTAKNSLGA